MCMFGTGEYTTGFTGGAALQLIASRLITKRMPFTVTQDLALRTATSQRESSPSSCSTSDDAARRGRCPEPKHVLLAARQDPRGSMVV